MRTIISEPKTLAFLLAAALSLAAAPARADGGDEQKAVQLFEKGRKLAKDGRCAEAIAPLTESLKYTEGVGTLLNLGACYETLGKTASAHRTFLRAQDVATKNDDRRKDEARDRAKALEKDVSTLLVHVPVTIKTSAEVRVDGEGWPRERWDVPWPIDPGVHEIEIEAKPQPKQTQQITVRPKGDHAEWAAAVPSDTKADDAPARPIGPPREPGADGGSSQRGWAYVAGGIGAAGLATGIIAGVISLSAHSSLVGRCPAYPTCDVSDKSQLDSMNGNAKLSGNISTVGLIAGVVLLGTGIALYFTAPKEVR